ncbi:hypothetical protein A0H81_12019 [Grifola frondosa]|uniref:Uncharacterized protein n=1 Tax=Grifola frondosa TaxID=5627 RepID=A0A1C7LMM5_GRIFR|nr:hypothetical protein A0H81_14816 [Grifola frondosa]OBZ68069.1 hypothetical protein A0H81_12019 [Grifola frondosa]
MLAFLDDPLRLCPSELPSHCGKLVIAVGPNICPTCTLEIPQAASDREHRSEEILHYRYVAVSLHTRRGCWLILHVVVPLEHAFPIPIRCPLRGFTLSYAEVVADANRRSCNR